MKKLITMLATLMFTLSSNATLISIELDKASYEVGDVANASILISDIEQEFNFQKLLATFELDIMFDPSIINYQSSTFGSKLDVDPFLPSDQFVDNTSAMGMLTLSEISYAFGSDLFAVQDGLASFSLASISFDVIAGGSSELTLENIVLGDDLAGDFNQVTTASSMLNVNSVGVPEGPSIMLFTLAIALFMQRKFAK